MNIKERIYSIVLEDKIKQNPKYAQKIGVEILSKTNNERKIENGKIKRRN